MRSTAPTRRRLGAGLAATLLAVALAACGSSDDGPGVATAGGGGSGAAAGGDSAGERSGGDATGREFARCMRDQGIDMDDPGGDGMLTLDMGVDMSDIDDALAACRPHMPNGGDIAPLRPEDEAALRNYAACMREQGVEMDDPDPVTGLTDQPRGPRDRVDAAAAACDEHLAGLRAGTMASDGGDV